MGDKWRMTYSWTQPYSVSLNPIYQPSSIEDEMSKVEMVDRWVDSMLTFPDAEAILYKIKKEIGND